MTAAMPVSHISAADRFRIISNSLNASSKRSVFNRAQRIQPLNPKMTLTPFSRPLYVMAKPAGATCNLKCKYCYYLEKQGLYKDELRPQMSDEMLELFVSSYLLSQTMMEVNFTWHGGEPLMRTIDFYQKALDLQQKYARGRRVVNCIQTNGTLLTDRWCEFFAKNHFLVGISIDGPQDFHDEYRRNKGGAPTWQKIVQGIKLLNKHGVEWNAMAVVNDFNAGYPIEFYRFFRDELKCRYLQFTPIVERDEQGEVTDFSVYPDQWGDFLCEMFDEWVRHDVGEMFVQTFDATLANWVGEAPGVCSLAPQCGHAGVMEWNGDVYSCDHFVSPDYRLGNIREKTLTEMMYSDRQMAFGRQKSDSLPSQCRQCDVRFACNGECPKNRFLRTSTGESGLNFLCAGYKRFFHHVKPYMDFMAAELKAGRDPANVIDFALKR